MPNDSAIALNTIRATLAASVFGLALCATVLVYAGRPDPAITSAPMAPAAEAPTARPVPVKPDLPALSRAIREVAPAGGAWVRLRDLPASTPRPAQQHKAPAARNADPAAGEAEARTKTPSSPLSPPPSSGASRAIGDEIRNIDGISGVEAQRAPPDVALAVGRDYSVQVVNAGLSVYSRLGTRLDVGPGDEGFWSLEDFFAANLPAGWQGELFGPRVLYDALRQRFVILVLGRDDVIQESYAFLALSDTFDATGDWCTRRITTTDTSGASPAWLDFAGLGVDSWGLYLTGNAIFWSGGKRGAQIRSFNTDIFDDCTQPLTFTRFPNVQWPSGGQADSLQPAYPHTINSEEETFFVGTRPDSGDDVLLATLSGDRASMPTLTRVEIGIPAYDAIGENVDQPGSATDLNGGRSNVQNAVYVNKRVFFSLTDDVLDDGSASGWLTVKLDTDLNTMEWHHLLWSGSGFYYFYPTLTVDGVNNSANVAVFGSYTDAETTITAATAFPSGVFKIYENQPDTTTGPLVVTPAGAAAYVRLDGDGVNAWGNYVGAAYDWTCNHAWGAVQHADTANRWKTTILARRFDDEGPCPRLEVLDPSEGDVWTAGTTQTINWLSNDLPVTDEIDIVLVADGPAIIVADGLPVNNTSYEWTVPEEYSDGAFLSIESADTVTNDLTTLDFSDIFVIADGLPPSPDPLTWDISPQPVDQTVLQMSTTVATDAGSDVEYRFEFIDSPTGGAGGSGSGWITANVYQDIALELNHQYCYAARARDAAGNTTGATPTRCAYSLAAAPIPGPFGRVSESSVEVRWGAGGNSQFTEYRVQNETTGTVSGWQTDTTWVSAGLMPNTAYSFRVQARNGDNIETVGVDLGAVSTARVDEDGDGIPWSQDNCTELSNPDQRDTDGDGFGNLCDADLNNNCIVNAFDLGLFKPVFFTSNPDADFDGDGVVNANDLGRLKFGFFQPPGPSGTTSACGP